MQHMYMTDTSDTHNQVSPSTGLTIYSEVDDGMTTVWYSHWPIAIKDVFDCQIRT